LPGWGDNRDAGLVVGGAQELVVEGDDGRTGLLCGREAVGVAKADRMPADAWLEGVVNAAIHRSYSLAGDHTRVEIFDDRIEVTSPGRFPGIVGLADPLTAPRFARNPRIARICADLDFGQELGEGIRRMYEEMRGAGLADPLYVRGSASVQLTLSAEPVDRELETRLPSEARQILAAVRGAERLSTADVASAIAMSRPATIKRLRQLEAERLIEWIGPVPRSRPRYS
jgi:ATP-dependent DNA helicase RecG